MKTSIYRNARSLAYTLAILTFASTCRAEIIDYIYQSGPNVVASFSGTVDTTDLTFLGLFTNPSEIIPFASGELFSSGQVAEYASISGPSGSFGSGSSVASSSSTGASFAFSGSGTVIEVPSGYTSGAFLSGSETFNSQTIASLTLKTGTYTYTWGTGPDADSLEVIIGTAPPVATTPEPSSLIFLGTGALGLVGAARRRFAV